MHLQIETGVLLNLGKSKALLFVASLFAWNVLCAQSFSDSLLENAIQKHQYNEAERMVESFIKTKLNAMAPVQRTYYYTLASNIKYKKGNYPDALTLSSKAIAEAATISDSIITYRAFLAHADVLQVLGKYETLHLYLDPAYQFASRTNHPSLLRQCYVQLGALSMQNNRLEEAKQWYIKALALSRKFKYTEYNHYDLLSVALTDLFLGNRDSSIINLDNAARLAEADKDSALLAATFNVRAHYHLLMNDRNAWRENVLRSLAIGQALKHPTLLSGGYSQLIEYALAERNFEEALQLDAQARQILQKTNMPFFVVHLDSLMYEAHKGMGKKDVALDYFEKYYKGKYAILTREQAERLDAIKASYDMKEKNMVIEKQRLELQYSERQTWFLLLLNLLFGILLAGGWFFRKMKKSYQGQLYKKEKWTEVLLAQKQKASALKSPFDPQKTQVTIAGEGNMPIPSEDLEFISEDKKELYDNMIQAIENQKLYLNPNLDVNLIVTTLGTNKFYLYQAISKNASENFRNIINRYRVEEAKRLIEQRVNDKSLHNVEAIHTEAGFNSPSSFYRIFRNFTGLTPKEYANEYKADMKSR